MKVGDTVLVSNPQGSLAEVWAGCTGRVEEASCDPMRCYPIKVRFEECRQSPYRANSDYEYFKESELSLVTEYYTFTGATDPPMDASGLEGVMKEEDRKKSVELIAEFIMNLINGAHSSGYIKGRKDMYKELEPNLLIEEKK